MDLVNKFKLVDGIFNLTEAKEVLLNLLEQKIKFHNHKIFCSEEMRGETHEHSVVRIRELKQVKSEVLQMFKELEQDDNGKFLTISASIDVHINSDVHAV